MKSKSILLFSIIVFMLSAAPFSYGATSITVKCPQPQSAASFHRATMFSLAGIPNITCYYSDGSSSPAYPNCVSGLFSSVPSSSWFHNEGDPYQQCTDGIEQCTVVLEGWTDLKPC